MRYWLSDRLNAIIHGLGWLLFVAVLYCITLGVGFLVIHVAFPPIGVWLGNYLRQRHDMPIFHVIVMTVGVMGGVWLRGWYNVRLARVNGWLRARGRQP